MSRPGAKAAFASENELRGFWENLLQADGLIRHNKIERAKGMLRQAEGVVRRNQGDPDLEKHGLLQLYNELRRKVGMSRPGAKAAFGGMVMPKGGPFTLSAPYAPFGESFAGGARNQRLIDANGRPTSYEDTAGAPAEKMLRDANAGRPIYKASRPGAKSAHAVNPFNLPAKPADWDGKRITLNNRQYAVAASAGGFDLYDLGSGKKSKTVTSEQLDNAWRSGKVRDIFASTGKKSTHAADPDAPSAEMIREFVEELRRLATNPYDWYTAANTWLSRKRAQQNRTIAIAANRAYDIVEKEARRSGRFAKTADDAVSRKIATLIREGYPRDQAVAIAYDMKRRGEL